MIRYLKVVLNVDEDDLDAVIDGMRTTSDDVIVDEHGDAFVRVDTDEELLEEAMCLGMCMADLEQDGIEDAFIVEVVMLEVEPIDIERKMN